MSIGTTGLTGKQYRLPKTIDLANLKKQSGLPPPYYDLQLQYVDNSGHVLVKNSPNNLLWSFDPTTGHMYVQGVNTNRYLNFHYRDFPPGPNSDGHLLETQP